MSDLSTTYMGLRLRNPIIVSSSKLTYDIEKVKECEKAGAGAVVLKSLFEEQIIHETERMIGEMNFDASTDAYDYLRGSSKDFHMDKYLGLVEEAKKEVSIPVIPSINCVSDGEWIEYAERFERMGADALELNVFIIPADVNTSGESIEEAYFSILKKVKKKVSIPVALKLGSHFSGMAHTMQRLAEAGSDGLVLFNRFYRPHIDIEKMTIRPAHVYSAPEEMGLTLQWIAILSGKVDADLAANTGIYSGNDVTAQLLAGASAVEVCSAFMKNGIEKIADFLKEMEEWMRRKEFSSVDEFKGLMSQKNMEHPEVFERSQYIKSIVGIE
ncbi:MAG: dihydroorotate dehydrogenase-like protein [Spirochaetaceae bacterium]